MTTSWISPPRHDETRRRRKKSRGSLQRRRRVENEPSWAQSRSGSPSGRFKLLRIKTSEDYAAATPPPSPRQSCRALESLRHRKGSHRRTWYPFHAPNLQLVSSELHPREWTTRNRDHCPCAARFLLQAGQAGKVYRKWRSKDEPAILPQSRQGQQLYEWK